MSKSLVTVVLCNWKSPEMLKACLNSLLDSNTFSTDIKVVLNEGNKDSANYLIDNKIDFYYSKENLGCAAVDVLTKTVETPFICTVNDDMLFHYGWQDDLFKLYKEHYPCVPCSGCVELENTYNHMVQVDNCGDILLKETLNTFRNNYLNGKYFRENLLGYNHPSLIKTEDWKAVGGYSLNLPFNHFSKGGYCLDDAFNYKIWKLYNEQIKFIVSGKSFVYHYVSYSGKRLPSEIKNFDSHSKFVEIAGMSSNEFRQKLNWGQTL